MFGAKTTFEIQQGLEHCQESLGTHVCTLLQ